MKPVFISLALLLFVYTQLMAQETYRKEKMNVMGTSYSGFSVQLPYGEQKAKDYLLTYLKDGGKISEKRNYIEIRENYWRPKKKPALVYAQVAGNQSESRIWIGYSQEADESFISALESQMESLPFIMHKQHLQAQIKEAEAASSFLSKELRQAELEAKRLSSRQERNAEEKIRLEKALEENKAEKLRLEDEVVGNEKDQVEKSQALEEVKKQLEYLQEKLRRL